MGVARGGHIHRSRHLLGKVGFRVRWWCAARGPVVWWSGGPKCVWVSLCSAGSARGWSEMRLGLVVLAGFGWIRWDSDAFWTTPARRYPDSQWSPQESGRRMCSGRACARIGVGYGVLGQVINLPQWGLSCPSR